MTEAGSPERPKKEARPESERPKRARIAESDMFGHVVLCNEEYDKAHFLVPLNGNEHHFKSLDLLESATAVDLGRVVTLLESMGALEKGRKLKLTSGQVVTAEWEINVFSNDDDE